LAMIRERTSKAMRHYQAQGRRMGRLDRCPYGKMPDPNGPMVKEKETGQFTERPARMIDHPEEQAVIERIRQLRNEGYGLRKIAKHLEEAGILCRGNRWHPSTIASILTSRASGKSSCNVLPPHPGGSHQVDPLEHK